MRGGDRIGTLVFRTVVLGTAGAYGWIVYATITTANFESAPLAGLSLVAFVAGADDSPTPTAVKVEGLSL